jgi:hypothetical protein
MMQTSQLGSLPARRITGRALMFGLTSSRARENSLSIGEDRVTRDFSSVAPGSVRPLKVMKRDRETDAA